MLPTLKIGDFIFVNKFSYGIRPPIFWNHKIIENNFDRTVSGIVQDFNIDSLLEVMNGCS